MSVPEVTRWIKKIKNLLSITGKLKVSSYLSSIDLKLAVSTYSHALDIMTWSFHGNYALRICLAPSSLLPAILHFVSILHQKTLHLVYVTTKCWWQRNVKSSHFIRIAHFKQEELIQSAFPVEADSLTLQAHMNKGLESTVKSWPDRRHKGEQWKRG